MTNVAIALPGRTYIESASEHGLVLKDTHADLDNLMPWSAVEGVTAGLAPYNDGSIFVLAFGFSGDQTILLGEIEPAWAEVTQLLHLYVPGIEPFSAWGPRLLENPGVMNL